MEYMAAQMDSQIEGAISENENLLNENVVLREMLGWAYGKLHLQNYVRLSDALMLDRMKLMLEHDVL